MRLKDCHNFSDFRKLAKKKLPSPIFHYIDGAADDEVTLRRNTQAFEKVDAILTPSTPSTAFEIENEPTDPVQTYLNDIFTVPINLAGIPAISIPFANDENDLPIGLQLITNSFELIYKTCLNRSKGLFCIPLKSHNKLGCCI